MHHRGVHTGREDTRAHSSPTPPHTRTRRFATEFIVDVEDVTPFVHSQRGAARLESYGELLCPLEEVYPFEWPAVPCPLLQDAPVQRGSGPGRSKVPRGPRGPRARSAGGGDAEEEEEEETGGGCGVGAGGGSGAGAEAEVEAEAEAGVATLALSAELVPAPAPPPPPAPCSEACPGRAHGAGGE
jgi:hypothetical protein